MIYRGFNIRTVDAIDLIRHNPSTGENESCHGVYCEVYDVADDGLTEKLDDFTLAEGYEIGSSAEAVIEDAIISYVDNHITELEYYRADAASDRRNHIIGRLVSWIGEEQHGRELYDTLSAYIGMTDEEIRACGFKSLVPYFNKDEYAQTIAEYMIKVGTENTTTGNWQFRFDEIGDKFGVDLSSNYDMVDKICKELYGNGETLSQIEVMGDTFDLTFYLKYCPYADSDEDINEGVGLNLV